MLKTSESMSNISPKIMNVEGNRIGDYIEKRCINNTKPTELNLLGSKKVIPSYRTGRFPTQLYTNIKNERFKYVKILN